MYSTEPSIAKTEGAYCSDQVPSSLLISGFSHPHSPAISSATHTKVKIFLIFPGSCQDMTMYRLPTRFPLKMLREPIRFAWVLAFAMVGKRHPVQFWFVYIKWESPRECSEQDLSGFAETEFQRIAALVGCNHNSDEIVHGVSNLRCYTWWVRGFLSEIILIIWCGCGKKQSAKRNVRSQTCAKAGCCEAIMPYILSREKVLSASVWQSVGGGSPFDCQVVLVRCQTFWDGCFL